MPETLRQVHDNLWVSDIDSAEIIGDDVSLVIDCTGVGPTRGNGRTLSIVADGHRWDAESLTQIANLAGMRLEAGGDVLIHCNRGVSRSVCAAAAVLLWMGSAKSVDEAIDLVRWEDRRPATVTVGSLKRWWDAQKQMSLF